jgi:hypothetical protein
LPLFSLTLSRRAHRRTPAAGDPPPCGASQHGRRSRPPSHLRSLPVASTSFRAISRPKPWPLAPISHRRRTSGKVPARRRRGPAWRRRRTHAGDRSRRSQPTAQIKRRNPPLLGPPWTSGLGPRRRSTTAPAARSKIDGADRAQPGPRSGRRPFYENPLNSLILCPNPSTFKRSSHIGPVFIVLTPDLLENPTRGP